MPVSVVSFKNIQYLPPNDGGGLPTTKVLNSTIFIVNNNNYFLGKDQKGLIKDMTILSVPGFSSAKLALEI